MKTRVKTAGMMESWVESMMMEPTVKPPEMECRMRTIVVKSGVEFTKEVLRVDNTAVESRMMRKGAMVQAGVVNSSTVKARVTMKTGAPMPKA